MRKAGISSDRWDEPRTLTSVLASHQIQTKTVAQCVEFYYTYKKQVKIGRNGTLTFGDVDISDEKSAQEEVEVDIKVTPFPASATESQGRVWVQGWARGQREEGTVPKSPKVPMSRAPALDLWVPLSI